MGRVVLIHPEFRDKMDPDVRWAATGAGSEYRKCIVHGIVKLVPIYQFVDDVTKEVRQRLYWGCMDCFTEKYGEPVEVNGRVCFACNRTDNLEGCPLCGVSVCKTHSIESVCCDCYEEAMDKRD